MESETDLLNYLKTLSKIQDIKRILESFNNTLQKDINYLENKCIDKILEYKLVDLIINHKNKEIDQVKKEIEEIKEEEIKEEEIKDDEMENQINNLSNLLGGQQEIDINNFDPKVFDSFGKGIGNLFNIKSQANKAGVNEMLIKNENNKANINNNFTFQIKKKI